MSDNVEGPLYGEDAARLGRYLVEQGTERDTAIARKALRTIWTDPVIDVWLTSANSHLDGARPIDLVALGNLDAVLEAVRVEVTGGSR